MIYFSLESLMSKKLLFFKKSFAPPIGGRRSLHFNSKNSNTKFKEKILESNLIFPLFRTRKMSWRLQI